jgi:hypothetical protein
MRFGWDEAFCGIRFKSIAKLPGAEAASTTRCPHEDLTATVLVCKSTT